MSPLVIGVTDNLARSISSPHKVAIAVIPHRSALPVSINDPDGTAPGITNPRIGMVTLPVIGDGYPTRKIREPC